MGKPADGIGTGGKAPRERNDEQLRHLVEGVREYAMYLLDPLGRVLTWNPGAERLKGYREAEVVGSHFRRFFTEEDAAAGVPERILAIAERDGSHRQQGWRVRKDGTRFWADVLVTALRDDAGGLRGYAKVTRDETERHAAEERLRESEERFRLLVGGLREHALYMLDPQGRVASWNEGAQRIKQYCEHEIIGRHFSAFFTADDRAAGKPQRELEIAEKLGVYEEEGWRVRKDGTRFWAAVVVTALRDAAGRLHGFSKVTRDETRRHQANVELQHALDRASEAEARLRLHANELEERVADRTRQLSGQAERLQALNAELEQFAYIASHDLQEPLRLVTLQLDLLTARLGEALDPRARAHIDTALGGAERMRSLIDALLRFSRIDHAPCSADEVDADAALAEALENLRPAIGERGARVTSRPLPRLRIEQAQLVQVFQNLVGNAIKYNRSGAPQVRVGAERDGEGWLVHVDDNGIGVDPAHVEQLFRPFRRLHRGDEFPGSGIGLAIVKKIVERHHGRVAAAPGPGGGARFTFWAKGA